jgi:hypothetical protein
MGNLLQVIEQFFEQFFEEMRSLGGAGCDPQPCLRTYVWAG